MTTHVETLDAEAPPETSPRHRLVDSTTRWMVAATSWTERVVGARATTWIITALFALQASWVAISSRPSIYDEGSHVKSIIAFAKRWTPFIDQLPSEANLGDLERDGTFFYYFLMSWPWRVMEGLGVSHDDAVLALRFTSVIAVTLGLVIFARVLRDLGASRAVSNLALFLVSMFPLLVFVAGSINYDNLIFLLLACLVWTFLRAYRSESLDVSALVASIALAGVTVITKFSAAPFLIVIAVLLLMRCGPQLWHERGAPWRAFLMPESRGLKIVRWLLLAVTIAVVALVVERYVGNVIRFGTPLPGCTDVHTPDFCENHAIYRRNEEALATHSAVPMTAPGAATFFATKWSVLMWRYLTLMGVQTAEGTVMVLGPGTSGAIVMYGSIALIVVLVLTLPLISRSRGTVPIVLACGAYLATLFLKNYSTYSQMGMPYAVQGRYVLILLPWLVGFALLGIAHVVRQYSVTAKFLTYLIAAVAIIVALTQGGGILMYLWNAEAAWITDRWPAVGTVSQWGHEFARELIVDKVVIPDPR